MIGLPEGPYHIVSTYLDTVGRRFVLGGGQTGKSAAPAPPAIRRPIPSSRRTSRFPPASSIDLTLRHRFATLTLKLVNNPGAEALANTTFTV